MEHAANRAAIDHEMSTTNRGRIVAMERGNIIGSPSGPMSREARINAAGEPADYTFGATGDMDVNDACPLECE